MSRHRATATAERYYDSSDADEFYHSIWGGEDIHVGCYESEDEPIITASRRTVTRMAKLCKLDARTKVVDLGAGYGGAARQICGRYGSSVSCVNLSEAQNQRNREKTRAAGLAAKIDVIHAAFEKLPLPDGGYDVVWSQDAFLHSADRRKVLAEARRVLEPGGTLVFTDPMQADDCPPGVLAPVLARIHLDTLGSMGAYERMARELGFERAEVLQLDRQLLTHYSRVRAELMARRRELVGKVSDEYIERMLAGLGHWIQAAQKGYLAWGILKFVAV